MAKWHYDKKGRKIGWWYTDTIDMDGNPVVLVTMSDAYREELEKSKQYQSENWIPDAEPTDYESQIKNARDSRYLIINTQTPPWADQEAIKGIYRRAHQKTRRYKKGSIKHVVYSVDHIVPLRGALVSGLHCEANLQIIPRYKNQTKSNKFVV